MIPSESARPSTIFALPPSALNRFESVVWKGVLPRRAAGSHTRVGPVEFGISTRVVTSNVRHGPGTAASARTQPIFGNTSPVDTAPADCKNLRRFMYAPSRRKSLFLLRRYCTPDFRLHGINADVE